MGGKEKRQGGGELEKSLCLSLPVLKPRSDRGK